MIQIDTKDPEEIVTASFPFATELAGAAVQGAVITVVVADGVDPAPVGLLSGASQVSGSDVLQKLKDGVAGVRYKVRCLATLSDGRKLMRSLVVDVRTL
jgi:hypothetical protein